LPKLVLIVQVLSAAEIPCNATVDNVFCSSRSVAAVIIVLTYAYPGVRRLFPAKRPPRTPVQRFPNCSVRKLTMVPKIITKKIKSRTIFEIIVDALRPAVRCAAVFSYFAFGFNLSPVNRLIWCCGYGLSSTTPQLITETLVSLSLRIQI